MMVPDQSRHKLNGSDTHYIAKRNHIHSANNNYSPNKMLNTTCIRHYPTGLEQTCIFLGHWNLFSHFSNYGGSKKM